MTVGRVVAYVPDLMDRSRVSAAAPTKTASGATAAILDRSARSGVQATTFNGSTGGGAGGFGP